MRLLCTLLGIPEMAGAWALALQDVTRPRGAGHFQAITKCWEGDGVRNEVANQTTNASNVPGHVLGLSGEGTRPSSAMAPYV